MTSSSRSTLWAGCSLWIAWASSEFTTWLTTRGENSLSTVIARRNLSRWRSITFLKPSSMAMALNYTEIFRHQEQNKAKSYTVWKLHFRPPCWRNIIIFVDPHPPNMERKGTPRMWPRETIDNCSSSCPFEGRETKTHAITTAVSRVYVTFQNGNWHIKQNDKFTRPPVKSSVRERTVLAGLLAEVSGGWLGMTQLLSAGNQFKPEVRFWNFTFL